MNFGFAPFLIVRLPHQIRVYTGFAFSQESKEDGLLDKAEHLSQLQEILANFNADTGRIWKSKYAERLNPDQRVDRRLLKNLEQLGQILRNNGLRDEVAHALIGKYVYLSYLRDRDILTDKWLAEKQINPDRVFTFRATINSLRTLVDALEDRFNGRIFPIAFDKEHILKDKHVSEIEWAKPLKRGMKLLDPACGSGVFLVLAYRRLIEKEMNHLRRKLKPEELRDILLESIYGVERERDACYVAEFGLILTLLHYSELYYTEPHDLQALEFQFPSLHNKQIFESDFFDIKGNKGEAQFWQQGLRFDWVVGNPPWIGLN